MWGGLFEAPFQPLGKLRGSGIGDGRCDMGGKPGWQETREEWLSCFVFLRNFLGRVTVHWELWGDAWLKNSRPLLSQGDPHIHFPETFPDNGMVQCYY